MFHFFSKLHFIITDNLFPQPDFYNFTFWNPFTLDYL